MNQAQKKLAFVGLILDTLEAVTKTGESKTIEIMLADGQVLQISVSTKSPPGVLDA